MIVTSQWRANRQFMHIAAHQQQTIYYINTYLLYTDLAYQQNVNVCLFASYLLLSLLCMFFLTISDMLKMTKFHIS